MSIDLERAKKAIQQHYSELSKEQFIKNLQDSAPEFFDDALLSGPRAICTQDNIEEQAKLVKFE